MPSDVRRFVVAVLADSRGSLLCDWSHESILVALGDCRSPLELHLDENL